MLPYPITTSFTHKRKPLSKSFESINSHYKNGYDHLYSEPYSYYDKNVKGKKKRKRKGFFSKKKNNFDELQPYPKKSFFGFGRKKWNKKHKRERKTFLDSRDCNERDNCKRSSFHEVCQQQFNSAKHMSKTIYNKIRYGYDYKLSYSSVVYSDRYFRYNLMLDTKIMPMKCFVSNDLGAPIMYKKFSKLQKNHLDFFININNVFYEDISSYTRHYMPMFTAWSIQPYSANMGPLIEFGDMYLFYHIDRRFYHRSIFEDLLILYEKSRRVDANYKPLFDMLSRCKEMMDYDEYIYTYARLGEMTHKQLQPLFHLEHKDFNYRLSDEGYMGKCFSEYDVVKRRKHVKKVELYQSMKGKTDGVSKFPVPDFALSDDQLLMRKKGSLYEKIKCEPEKIYDKLMKESPHISAANLAHAEIHQSIKNIDKSYSTRKVLNTEVRRSLSIDRQSSKKSVYNNDRSTTLSYEKTYDMKPIQQMTTLDRNNMIVMEPLLLMQTLNEDREQRKRKLAMKNQKIIIRVMLTYSTVIYVLMFVIFYFFSLT